MCIAVLPGDNKASYHRSPWSTTLYNISYVMLYYVMLCYAMVWYVMLCYAMLCHAMVCYVMLCRCRVWIQNILAFNRKLYVKSQL